MRPVMKRLVCGTNRGLYVGHLPQALGRIPRLTDRQQPECESTKLLEASHGPDSRAGFPLPSADQIGSSHPLR